MLQVAFMLFLASIAFFLLVHFQPGTACPAGVAAAGCAEQLHLDQPMTSQYVEYVGQLAHADLGTSQDGLPVRDLVAQKFPLTALLLGVSVVFQQLIALPLGILAAIRPRSFFDRFLTALSYLALAVPCYLLGAALIYFFTVRWGLLPAGHAQDDTQPLFLTSEWFSAVKNDPGLVLGDMIHHLLLPVIVLTAAGVAIDSRFMRSALMQVLSEDYMRTARAKGVARRAVIFKHALRNALPPIVTNIGVYLPSLVAGTLVVETVFTWGGIGYAFNIASGASGTGLAQGTLYALRGSVDFPVLQALLMLSTFGVLLANLVADVIYAWLDPRIRFDG